MEQTEADAAFSHPRRPPIRRWSWSSNGYRGKISNCSLDVVGSDALVLHYLPEVDMRTHEIPASEGWCVGSTRRVGCLPAQMRKIETTLMRELGTNAGDLAIVRAIIGLAEAFRSSIVCAGDRNHYC